MGELKRTDKFYIAAPTFGFIITEKEIFMNAGIIVYSQTGTTLKVCEQIKSGLEEAGHTAAIEKVEIASNSAKDRSNIEFTNRPDPLKYEALVFASPVQAFSLALPMQKYLDAIGGLEGRKAALLTTKGLPFKWTGASHALSQMKNLAGKAGAEIVNEGIVLWPARNSDSDTAAAVKEIKELFEKS